MRGLLIVEPGRTKTLQDDTALGIAHFSLRILEGHDSLAKDIKMQSCTHLVMKLLFVELLVELDVACDAPGISLLPETKDGLETDSDFVEGMTTNTRTTFMELRRIVSS